MISLFKKGIALIMFIALLITAITFIAPTPAMAGGTDYNIAASTFPVTNAVLTVAQISGKAKVDLIIASNSGVTAQRVTIYELSDSTITISARLIFDLPALAVEPVIIPFPSYNAPIIDDLCVRKSTTGTTVNVFLRTR